jgi:hypothetical protein
MPRRKSSLFVLWDNFSAANVQDRKTCLLRVYKRSNPIQWEQKQPPPIDFLAPHRDDIVRVLHHYPAR